MAKVSKAKRAIKKVVANAPADLEPVADTYNLGSISIRIHSVRQPYGGLAFIINEFAIDKNGTKYPGSIVPDEDVVYQTFDDVIDELQRLWEAFPDLNVKTGQASRQKNSD